mgnify:CR=1 FL=1
MDSHESPDVPFTVISTRFQQGQLHCIISCHNNGVLNWNDMICGYLYVYDDMISDVKWIERTET